jgi:hypothetical protein
MAPPGPQEVVLDVRALELTDEDINEIEATREK